MIKPLCTINIGLKTVTAGSLETLIPEPIQHFFCHIVLIKATGSEVAIKEQMLLLVKRRNGKATLHRGNHTRVGERVTVNLQHSKHFPASSLFFILDLQLGTI
jgi:hypothetical protein